MTGNTRVTTTNDTTTGTDTSSHETRKIADPVVSPRLAAALAYAVTIHGRQPRKGGNIPYVSHLLAVAGLVLEHGGTEDQAIAGLLHDSAEDGPEWNELTGEQILDDIEDRFGGDVVRMVRECSDTTESPKPAWEKRKRRYLGHLANEVGLDTVLVSACDKLHNLTSIATDLRQHGEAMFDRFNGTAAQVRWYYGDLVDIYETRLGEHHSLVRSLRETLSYVNAETAT